MAKAINSMEELFVEQLQDLYDAERQIIKALPKMAKAASTSELKAALEEHLEQTLKQCQRLEQIFEALELPAKAHKCEGMKGIIKEGEEIIKRKGESAVKDAALIAAAQRVEHYEIAGYGCVCSFANLMLEEEAASLLHQTLEEEKETDQKLSQLAKGMINMEAVIE